jgi:hypothetical protein
MAPKAEKSGCDGDGKIGRLVVLPTSSDGDGDDVAIRVVTGVNKRAEDCTPESGYAGCIVARRLSRFVPNETIRITVEMSALCKDKPCSGGQTCDEHTGECIATKCEGPACEADAGPVMSKDAAGVDAAIDAVESEEDRGLEAGIDVFVDLDSGVEVGPTDTGFDAFGACQTLCLGGTCEPDGTCVRACDTKGECTGLSCPPGIPCRLECSKNDACHDVDCGQASNCTIHCSAAQACTVGVSCGTSATCSVTCSGAMACATIECPHAHNAQCDVTCNGSCAAVRCCDDGTCNVSGTTPSRDPSYCVP